MHDLFLFVEPTGGSYAVFAGSIGYMRFLAGCVGLSKLVVSVVEVGMLRAYGQLKLVVNASRTRLVDRRGERLGAPSDPNTAVGEQAPDWQGGWPD